METVWITGASGLIGNYLVQTAPIHAADSKIIPLTRPQLELTDFAAVRKKFSEDKPDLVIHCAALSRNLVCQAQPALARKLNIEVTAHLAELAAEIPLIFFSSDLVFDGRKGNYVETDSPNPLTIYGETKIAAEKIVLQNPRHSVIRTSLNCGKSTKGNHAFNEEMRHTWQTGQTAKLFSDEFRCPIPAVVTARAVWELAARSKPGLYHLCGTEKLSRVQMGNLIAARCPELNPKIEISSLKNYSGPLRPADTSLCCDKIQKLLSFPIPGLTQWLQENPREFF